MFKIGSQKHFTKLPKMKNTQSETKPIKIGKRPRTTYCFECKHFTHNFRPEEVKITSKVLREKCNCIVCRWSRLIFLKEKHNNKTKFYSLQTDIMKIRWRLIAWSVEKILKILTQKWLEQKIIDSLCKQNVLFAELKSRGL